MANQSTNIQAGQTITMHVTLDEMVHHLCYEAQGAVKQKVGALENEIEDLKNQIEHDETVKRLLMERIDEKYKEVKELKDQCEKNREETHQVQIVNELTKKQNDENLKEMAALVQVIEKQEKKFHEMVKSKDDEMLKLKDLVEREQGGSVISQIWKERLMLLQTQADQAKEEVAQMRKEREEYERQKRVKENRVKELQTQVAMVQQRIREAAQEVTSLYAVNGQLEGDNMQQGENIDRLEARVREEQQRNEEMVLGATRQQDIINDLQIKRERHEKELKWKNKIVYSVYMAQMLKALIEKIHVYIYGPQDSLQSRAEQQDLEEVGRRAEQAPRNSSMFQRFDRLRGAYSTSTQLNQF